MVLQGWPWVVSPGPRGLQHVLAAPRLSAAFLKQSFSVGFADECNYYMSRTLRVCSHAVVLILLAFGPIQLRCEGGRTQESKVPVCHEQMQTSQHRELVGKVVRGRNNFCPSTPWLAIWISLCGPSHTTVGQPTPCITFFFFSMAVCSPSWLYASHEATRGNLRIFFFGVYPFQGGAEPLHSHCAG